MKDNMEITDRVEQLFVFLDRDTDNLQKTLLRLDQMRSAVIKRDEVSLARILDEVRCEQQGHQEHLLQRRLLREELAEILGCSYEDATLTKLQEFLSEDKSGRLAEKKEQLRVLTGKLRKEYAATVFLLAESARFNRLLLNAIFDRQKVDVITYDSAGAAKRQSQPACPWRVNMKL